MTAETLLEYDVALLGSDARTYAARSCGRRRDDDGMWEGWIEFDSSDGANTWRTTRETTQPNRADLMYWATGVSAVYLEGALSRAMDPPPRVVLAEPAAPVFDGPAEATPEAAPLEDAGEPVLDPDAVYASKGEHILRRQLGALAAWHLRTIARVHCNVAALRADVLDKLELIETIVAIVKARALAAAQAVAAVPESR